MFRCARLVLLSLCVSIPSFAQTRARTVTSVFVKAQELVSDGNGAAGRALVDSVLKANSPTSQIYPEALYWRASLAASAADAESDYKHIVVDFPLAPQAEDALLRLAQLELARGDKDGALAHLQKISRDYPRSKSLARASYWTARVLFEKNDISSACAANANAVAQVGAEEIELQNQIQYQGQRCASYSAAKVVSPGTVPQPATGKSPTVVPSASAPAASSNASAASSPVSTPTVQSSGAQQETSRMKVPAQANDTKPSIVDAHKLETSAPERGSTKQADPKSTEYSVQVAAYNKRPEAEKLVATLRARGYEARVDGSEPPFRVRIGRFASSKEADAALGRIKAKHMEGFVVRAPER